jgi:hypothetical protein
LSDERRNQRRVPFLIEVVWDGPTGKHEARTSDISIGGCFVDAVSQATVGETINFRMSLPSGDSMEITGEVTYVAESIGFGIRFTECSPENQKKLEWLVKAAEFREKGGQ